MSDDDLKAELERLRAENEDMEGEIRAFLRDNESKLKTKGDE